MRQREQGKEVKQNKLIQSICDTFKGDNDLHEGRLIIKLMASNKWEAMIPFNLNFDMCAAPFARQCVLNRATRGGKGVRLQGMPLNLHYSYYATRKRWKIYKNSTSIDYGCLQFGWLGLMYWQLKPSLTYILSHFPKGKMLGKVLADQGGKTLVSSRHTVR